MDILIKGLAGFISQYILTGGIILLILAAVVVKRIPKYLPILIFIVSLILAYIFQHKSIVEIPLFKLTSYSSFFFHLAFLSGLLCSFLIENSRLALSDKKSELYILLLFSILGMTIVSISSNLLTLFLGIECISISSYCLAAFGFSPKSSESAMKYVLYGSATSGIMIFGMSLIYGLTGTMDINELILKSGLYNRSMLYSISLMMILSGLLFKIAAFPFHSWAPDVYEGTPTPLVAFFSIAPKALALYGLILLSSLYNNVWQLKTLLIIVSVLSITVGNLLALNQNNAKRMLAYSSIAHAGFLLMGIVIGGNSGPENIMYYLTIYILMNFSAFHLLQIISRGKENGDIREFAGLGKNNPYLATSLLITMISLTGLPPAAGFTAKLFMFSGVYESYKLTGDISLFIMLSAGLLNTVLSLFYYLKMPFYAFFRDNKENKELQVTFAEKGFILALNALLLILFLKPDWVFKIIKFT